MAGPGIPCSSAQACCDHCSAAREHWTRQPLVGLTGRAETIYGLYLNCQHKQIAGQAARRWVVTRQGATPQWAVAGAKNKNPQPHPWPGVLDQVANDPIGVLPRLLLRQFVDRAAAADDLGDGNRWVEQVVVRAVLRLVVDLAGAAGQQGNARNESNSNSSFDQLFHKKSFSP